MSENQSQAGEETTNDVQTEQSLDEFAAELFGGSEAASDNATSDETPTDKVSEDDASEQQESEDQQQTTTESETEETLEETEEEETSDEEEDTLATEKPKKNRFQERINELTAARKEAERKAETDRLEYEQRIRALEEKLNSDNNKENETQSSTEASPPDPNAKDKDGNPVYELGELDPQYVKDSVQYMFDQRDAEQAKKAEESAKEREIDQAQAELQQSWNNKLVDVQERYPDFQEKGEQMLSVFEGIDEQYGNYLTNTLMEMDSGPEVFYYLSNNVEEAQRIVNSGPKKATMELAKIEGRLSTESTKSSPEKKVKVTKAKTPPPQNKGSAVAAPSVPHDTDDLAAFERELFRSSR